MQSIEARSTYKNSFHCAARIFKEEGVLMFWSGAVPRLGRLILSGGIVFTMYVVTPSSFQILTSAQVRKVDGTDGQARPRRPRHLRTDTRSRELQLNEPDTTKCARSLIDGANAQPQRSTPAGDTVRAQIYTHPSPSLSQSRCRFESRAAHTRLRNEQKQDTIVI